MLCVNAAEESTSAVQCFGFLASLSSQSIEFFSRSSGNLVSACGYC